MYRGPQINVNLWTMVDTFMIKPFISGQWLLYEGV